MITGGEPLLQQQALMPLIISLSKNSYTIEIETNGTIEPIMPIFKLVNQGKGIRSILKFRILAKRKVFPRNRNHFALNNSINKKQKTKNEVLYAIQKFHFDAPRLTHLQQLKMHWRLQTEF